MEMENEKNSVQNARLTPDSLGCLFAHMPNTGITIGVVSASEPSSLALLAAGVAGMATRRARRERTK